MANPKVTVLMSVYNGEKYLKKAVDSVLNQTFKDFEFLIINDGATDKTLEILQSYDDPRIKIINNESNIGLTKSLNKGLKAAKGEYIARMDADDISLQERIKKEVDYLEKHKNTGLVGVFDFIIDKDSKKITLKSRPTENKEIKNLLTRNENQFCSPAAMFRKKCIEQVGNYREEFKFAQDYDLWLRIAERYEVANIPEALYEYRITPNSVSVQRRHEQSKYAEFARELAKERRKYGQDKLQTLGKEETKRILSRRFSGIKFKKAKNSIKGCYYYSLANILSDGEEHRKDARKFLFKSLSLNPFNLQAYRLLIIFFLPPQIVKKIRQIKKHLNLIKKQESKLV